MNNKSIGKFLLGESVLAIAVLLYFGVCPNNGHMKNCYTSFVVSIILFTAMLLISLICLTYKKRDIAMVACGLEVILNLAVIVGVYFIVGICEMPTMICRRLTFPIITLIIIISTIVDTFFIAKVRKK